LVGIGTLGLCKGSLKIDRWLFEDKDLSIDPDRQPGLEEVGWPRCAGFA
jgi:hypothetical protein